MSYAHTKRQKTIASLKREEARQRVKDNKKYRWRDELARIGDAVRKRNDGPFVGSLADILAAQ